MGTSGQHCPRTSRRLCKETKAQEPENHQRSITITPTITQKILLLTMKKERREAYKNNDCICRHTHRHTYIQHLRCIFPILFHYISNLYFHSIFSTYQENKFFLSTFHLLLVKFSNLVFPIRNLFSIFESCFLYCFRSYVWTQISS